MSLNKRIKSLDRQIKTKEKELKKLKKQEKTAIDKWRKLHYQHVDAAEDIVSVRSGTKKKERLSQIILGFRTKSEQVTKGRNDARAKTDAAKQELVALQTERTLLSSQILSETKAVDDIVTSVFRLNDSVVEASKGRAGYLTQHVFKRLIGDDGKLRSQVSFTSADGLRRVIAMTNTMTLIQGDMAAEAKLLIEQFFERFQQTAAMDRNTKILYDLTHQLLIEKTKFQVGDNLYLFLGMDIDKKTLPELHEAQQLLRHSIRSEKTSSYIRIKQRESTAAKWIDVPQS